MSYYPVFMDLKGRRAVVVGGGHVALRKIETLIGCGAKVHVISRELVPEIRRYVDNNRVKFLGNEFDEGLIDEAFLIVTATDDRALNRRIYEAAERRNILVNTVDQPDECSFIVPSVIRRGGLIIAISTSGRSPALSKKIRKRLEEQFGDEYDAFLNMMGRVRSNLLSMGMSESKRAKIFHELVDSAILESIGKNDLESVASELERILERPFSADEIIEYMKEG